MQRYPKPAVLILQSAPNLMGLKQGLYCIYTSNVSGIGALLEYSPRKLLWILCTLGRSDWLCNSVQCLNLSVCVWCNCLSLKSRNLIVTEQLWNIGPYCGAERPVIVQDGFFYTGQDTYLDLVLSIMKYCCSSEVDCTVSNRPDMWYQYLLEYQEVIGLDYSAELFVKMMKC